MRLSLVPPDQLTSEQRSLYDRCRRQIAGGFTAFKTVDDEGVLLGPWGVFIQEPAVGSAHYDLVDAITDLTPFAGADSNRYTEPISRP